MKTILATFIALTVTVPALAAPGAPASPAESCQQCGTMKHLIDRADQLKGKAMTPRTVEDQDQLISDASLIIYNIIKRSKPPTLATARLVMTLTAKVVPFANSGIIGDDNSELFRAHWSRKDNVYTQAVDQLVSEAIITDAEKTAMLVELGVIKQKEPKRRGPQSTNKK